MKNRLLFTLLLSVVVATTASADVLTTASSWSSWKTPTQSNNPVFSGTPFWDNGSWDGNYNVPNGNNCNIGFWLSGSGGCTVTNFYSASPNKTADFLGDGHAAFSFTTVSGSTTSITGMVGVSALSGSTEFGWMGIDGTPHKLLEGAPFGTSTGLVVPSGDYVFYATVTNGATATTFRSDQLDSLGRARFTVFDLSDALTARYAIGFEDIGGLSEASDYDYNDFIFMFSSSIPQVPEPATIALMGSGLIGMGILVRRRRQR